MTWRRFYRSDPGQRANNDIEQRQLSLTLKQQLTPQDGVYANIEQYDATFGDLQQYYDPGTANPNLRVKETQDPIIGLGYNHAWSPGARTLFFATRLNDTTSFTNPAAPTLLAFEPEFTPGVPTLTSVEGLTMQENFADRLTIYSAELQQIWEQPAHTTVIGGRVQYGHFNTANEQDTPSTLLPIFPNPPAPEAQQDITSVFKRVSFYGYHQWQVFDPLQLIGGLTYDRITFPENFRSAPISGDDKTVDQFSPKAGIIWTPAGKYHRPFCLHPLAVRRERGPKLPARTFAGGGLHPKTIAASFLNPSRARMPVRKFETYDLSLEQKFRTGNLSHSLRRDTGLHRGPGCRDLFSYDPFSDERADISRPLRFEREDLDYHGKIPPRLRPTNCSARTGLWAGSIV
jgi:hypothetical protein